MSSDFDPAQIALIWNLCVDDVQVDIKAARRTLRERRECRLRRKGAPISGTSTAPENR
jgi:hypothetical protein